MGDTMNEKKEKFHFADSEEMKEVETNNEIEVVSSPKEVKVDISKEETDEISVDEDKKKSKLYYSFEARIITRIFIVFTLFVTACILIHSVINHTVESKVVYNESSKNSYEVCLKNNTCQEENITYNSNDINIIKVAFDYDNKYSKKIKYGLAYYVLVEVKAYDKNGDVIYNKDKKLVDDIDISNTGDAVNIHERVTVDYSRYMLDLAYVYSSKAECIVSLYLREPNEIRKVSSVKIPLKENNFEIQRFNTSNINKETTINVNLWDNYSIICSTISAILILITLIIIYRTTRLVLKVTNSKSVYEQEVDDILKEYDNIIVVAKDGYEVDNTKEVIKLEVFEDLLKVQSETQKPIIYLKINDIKCEFLIDDDRLYKVVLKESDYE